MQLVYLLHDIGKISHNLLYLYLPWPSVRASYTNSASIPATHCTTSSCIKAIFSVLDKPLNQEVLIDSFL